MSKTTMTISSQFSLILALGALLTWVIYVPTEVRADDPSQRMMRSGQPGQHGRAMTDFGGHSLHLLLRH